MNLLKLTDKKITIIFIIAGSIVSLLFLVLTSLKLKNNRGLHSEVRQILETIENVQFLTKDERKFSEKCEEIQNKMELVLKKTPKEAQIPQTIDQLTLAIEQSNLKVISIIPKEIIEIRKQKEPLPGELETSPEIEGEFAQEVETPPDYIQIPIEIQLRGSYENIGNYLNSLRFLPRLVTIEEINIEKVKELESLDIKLVVSIWYTEK